VSPIVSWVDSEINIGPFSEKMKTDAALPNGKFRKADHSVTDIATSAIELVRWHCRE